MAESQRLTTVFLDRDGVINAKAPRDGYVESWKDFHFLPGAREAVAALRNAGLTLVVVTNQRGVARSRLTATTLEQIHRRMMAAGLLVHRVYYCPHEYGECDCRKPHTGMFEKAAGDFPWIRLGRSAAIVGDAENDMAAGRALGLVLVKIGDVESPVDHACRSLGEAADWLLNSFSVPGPSTSSIKRTGDDDHR